jgi:hypothetical protein
VITIYAFAGSSVALVAAAWCFKANQAYRGAIDDALGATLNVPERVYPFYGAAYLNRFISTAARRPTVFDRSALALYIRPTLLWIDVGFAIFCAGFSALFWWALTRLFSDHHSLELFLRFFLVMSVVYGVADVSEDLWLARLFSRGSKITAPEGAIACFLTQTKLLSFVLSIVGAMLFALLGKIFAADRTP